MPETVVQYKQRLTSYLGRQDPLRVQAATPAKLQRLLARVPAARQGRRPQPARWSVREIVAHLADVEMVIGFRIRLILGQPGVAITPFDQDRWTDCMGYNRRPSAASLAAFRAMRTYNLALLKSLTPKQWKQAGVHGERGAETVTEIARMLAGHDLNHLLQLEQLVG